MKLSNFRGPFTIGKNAVDVNYPIYDAQEEFIGTVTAPDDNTHGVKFAKDHAELFAKSFELLEALTETKEMANHGEMTAEQKLEAIRAICGKFI